MHCRVTSDGSDASDGWKTRPANAMGRIPVIVLAASKRTYVVPFLHLSEWRAENGYCQEGSHKTPAGRAVERERQSERTACRNGTECSRRKRNDKGRGDLRRR